jgi:ATP-dependent RNA helicase DHX37/DHR1
MPKFVPRQRKHKVLARQKSHKPGPNDTNANANATEIVPAEKRERDERKKEMKAELAQEAQGKMSGKKRKRLDKYIVRSHMRVTKAS